MKTTEELNALKEEVETLSKKLAALNDDELAQVSGGTGYPICPCAGFCVNSSKDVCTYFRTMGGRVRCKYD